MRVILCLHQSVQPALDASLSQPVVVNSTFLLHWYVFCKSAEADEGTSANRITLLKQVKWFSSHNLWHSCDLWVSCLLTDIATVGSLQTETQTKLNVVRVTEIRRSRYPPCSWEMRYRTIEQIRKVLLLPRAFQWLFLHITRGYFALWYGNESHATTAYTVVLDVYLATYSCSWCKISVPKRMILLWIIF